MQASLVLLNGPSRGAVIMLGPSEHDFTIGRDESRSLPLDDPMSSRLHARFWFDGLHWLVEDCKSRNGTCVNSRAIDRVMLSAGDVIRIGDRLMVFAEGPDAKTAPQLQPSESGASTFVVRLARPNEREAVIEQLRLQADSRPLRDAAVLWRFAAQFHQLHRAEDLVRLVIEGLREGVGADRIAVWLAGPDGRLECAGRHPVAVGSARDLHWFATLAVENDEALLVNRASEQASGETISDDAPNGDVLSVPIPGREHRRGAIECHRDGGPGVFERADLDLAIAIARQFGLALEAIEFREQLAQANEQLLERLASQSRIVGSSEPIRAVQDRIARVAPTPSTSLITGETGVGKELVAQSIHEMSDRRAGPFVAVNCAAFTESLLESELFGHERGAFTGADQRRRGQFERAHRGSIFLDEVGEMSPACQVKLLRVLEGHVFERVGGAEPIRVDVRIIAATHRDLPELVEQDQFRRDLLYRLRVIDLHVPPLRERGADVIELAGHFVQRFHATLGRGPDRLSPEAKVALVEYDWPGNVRELKNAIERAVILGIGPEIMPGDLALPGFSAPVNHSANLMSLAEAERRYIQHVLEQVDGNKTRACKILAIGRGTLYKRLSE